MLCQYYYWLLCRCNANSNTDKTEEILFKRGGFSMSTLKIGDGFEISSPVTSLNRNIPIPTSTARSIGRFVVRQSGVEDTDVGNAQRKIVMTINVSGAPVLLRKNAANTSAFKLGSDFDNDIGKTAADFVNQNNIISKEFSFDNNRSSVEEYYNAMSAFGKNRSLGEIGDKTIKELNDIKNNNPNLSALDIEAIDNLILVKSGETIRIDNVSTILKKEGVLTSDLNVDLMDGKSVRSFLSYMDKYAEAHNLNSFSSASTKSIEKMINTIDKSHEMYDVASVALSAKEHLNNLEKINRARRKQALSTKRLLRSAFKDADAIEGGLMLHDAVSTTRRAVKIVKSIASRNRSIHNTQQLHKEPKKITNKETITKKQKAVDKTAKTISNNTIKEATITKTTTLKTKSVKTIKETKEIIYKTISKVVASKEVWIAIGIILAALLLIIIFTSIISGLSTYVTGFFGTSDEKNVDNVYESQAGIIYTELREKDATFIDTIKNYRYTHTPEKVTGNTVYGYWNPNTGSTEVLSTWSKASTSWKNGDGESISSPYNTKDIISAGTVFIGSSFSSLEKTFEAYTDQLWRDTHNYSISYSDIYACSDGCTKYIYYCNDSYIYDNVNLINIPNDSVIPFSENGCYSCNVSYCDGCETSYCEGFHNGIECTGHIYCPGHLSNNEIKCVNCEKIWKSTLYACSGCSVGENGITYCPNGNYHYCEYYTYSCSGHCNGHDVAICLGHIDLRISVVINFLDDEQNSLFDVDTIGTNTGKKLSIADSEKYEWNGWSDSLKARAILIASTDWYALYGIGTSSSDYSSIYTPVSYAVESYAGLINLYATTYGIPEYAELIKAVMMQESGGQGSDPMQSSECGYNIQYPQIPNGITDPTYSIQVGIQYLADCLKQAGATGPSDLEHIKTALQGYNYGTGYIAWALENYGGYSLSNAAEFSAIMAEKCGWSSYGDPQYVPHVLRYYILSQGNQSIVEVALAQTGNIGGEPYWSWYGFDSRVAWCACFVSWCANQCGYIDSGAILKFAYCPTGINWFKEQGRWKDRYYEPLAGDIIFFDWEGDGESDHVGIVIKTEDGVVYTIEGNSSDVCKQKQYIVGSDSICGYGIPAYQN